jgi:hypothetical protein
VQAAEATLQKEAQLSAAAATAATAAAAAAAAAAAVSSDVQDTGAVQLSHQAATLCKQLIGEQKGAYSELYTALQGVCVCVLSTVVYKLAQR